MQGNLHDSKLRFEEESSLPKEGENRFESALQKQKIKTEMVRKGYEKAGKGAENIKPTGADAGRIRPESGPSVLQEKAGHFERCKDEKKVRNAEKLKFEKAVKPQGVKSAPVSGPVKGIGAAMGSAGSAIFHEKAKEAEKDNTGAQAVNQGTFAAEKTARSVNRFAARHRRQDRSAEAEKAVSSGDEKQGFFDRFSQKRKIRKDYQAEAREKARKAAEAAEGAGTAASAAGSAGSAGAAKKTGKNLTDRIGDFAEDHKQYFLIAGVMALVIGMFTTCGTGASSVFSGGMNTVVATSYVSEDADIHAADDYYTQMETDLRNEVNSVPDSHPGYDEYRYDLADIGHNPYELTSYLTAKYEAYTLDQVKDELDSLFHEQYTVEYKEVVETRYRTETHSSSYTDNGHTYTDTWTEQVPYDYYILYTTLSNKTLPVSTTSRLTDDQKQVYDTTLQVYGNKPYLWDDIYSKKETDPAEGSYEVPAAALSDPSFAALHAEAEKYLGYPYVWGGSSPSTSFDCSGFVCWVYTHSGVHDLPRCTAQEIYNQCTRVPGDQAEPGDLVFFTGTYNSGTPVTHVGIYVGNNMMIHCGNPIKYSSIDSTYFQNHFYAFGRLN